MKRMSDDSAIYSILLDLQPNVVLKHRMTCECRPHAVVIKSVSPDNGVKTEKEKPT